MRPEDERSKGMYEISRLETPHRPVFTPDIDIHETDSGLVLTADLPGVSKEGLDVSVVENVLKIHGRVVSETPKGAKLVLQEYREGDYYRSFILSDEVDADSIRAEFEAGVLTLTLPKAKRLLPRKIEVEAK